MSGEEQCYIKRRDSKGILSLKVHVLVIQSCQALCDSMVCPWNFPSKDTGVGCHSLLQGIFPTQRSNPGLLHCRQIKMVGCMRWVFRAGALGRLREMGWRGRQKRGLGWRTHVNPWLFHVNIWQKPLQHCKVISLQWIKINGKKKYQH